MKISSTKLSGVFVIETDIFHDDRGIFVKVFHSDIFKENDLNVDFKESFYSISHKNVIRGMHFHLPPKEHAKLVYVTSGSILDVILDLRKNSPTYGQFSCEKLSQENHKMVYIPVGCAHGFLSLEDNSCTVYLQTTTYSQEYDAGIKIDSFGMDWGIASPIVSGRDQGFSDLKDFISPFN